MKPTVSVVIPTYNRASLLESCLESMVLQSMGCHAFEVLVVDDGSTDATVEILEKFRDRSPLQIQWHQQAHAGPAAARNLGVQRARGDLIAFTDDDCVADPDWLEALAGSLPPDPLCAGVGGPVRRTHETIVSRYIDHSKLMSHWQTGDTADYLITANAIFRTASIRNLGGFNDQFELAGGEDVDLSYRLQQSGYYLLTLKDRGAIRHNHHDTISEFWKMCWRHGFGAQQLGALGLVEQSDCTVLFVFKQTIWTLLSGPQSGSSGLLERLSWLGLSVLQNFAKCAGNRAWSRRHRRTEPA